MIKPLDVKRFAGDGGELAGELDPAVLVRLAESTLPPLADTAPEPVRWRLVGESRPVPGAADEIRLSLHAATTVSLTCQRCLQRLEEPIDAQRHFLFVRDEDEAARLDEELDEDVLVLTRHLDVQALIEDELILSLPLVPRHAVCPAPLLDPAEAGDAAPAARENPFAVLAGLKKAGQPS
jgi:uncharacterized protein